MKQINEYFNNVFTKPDEVLDSVINSIEEHGMHQISLPPASGKHGHRRDQFCAMEQLF